MEQDRDATQHGLEQLLQAEVAKDSQEVLGRRALCAAGQAQTHGQPSVRRELGQRISECGVPLARFLPPEGARLSALGVGQRRYYAMMADPETGEGRLRSCFQNLQTKAKRLELPVQKVGGERRKFCLHATCDQGSVGWPGMMWWYYGCSARGTQLRPMSPHCERLALCSDSVKLGSRPLRSATSGRPSCKSAPDHGRSLRITMSC